MAKRNTGGEWAWMAERVGYVASCMRPGRWAAACWGLTDGPRSALCSQDMNNSFRPSSSSPSTTHLLLFPLPSTASHPLPPFCSLG